MTPTALKAAAQVGLPATRSWGRTRPARSRTWGRAGEAAIGFICAIWWGTGTHFPLIQEVLQYVYARGKGGGARSRCWHGSLEAGRARRCAGHRGHPHRHAPIWPSAPTGAQVQWGLDHLSITAAALKELGLEGLISPITLSCRDHEGGGGVKFQQWDGTQWTVLTNGWRQIRRWCGRWSRRRRPSMRRRRGSRRGTVRKCAAPEPRSQGGVLPHPRCT